MIKQIYLSVLEVNVEISSEIRIINAFLNNIEVLSAVIPLLRVGQVQKDYDFGIVIEISNTESLSIDSNNLDYSIKYSSFEILAFTYTILTPIFATCLLRKNFLFLHGAVVDKDMKGYLLIGNGKTTTAVNLCRFHNFQLVAEDNFVLLPSEKIILSECKTVNLDPRLIGYTGSQKIRMDHSKLGIAGLKTTKLKMIFILTAAYDKFEVIELTSFEKSSVICTLINERLLNYSRWNDKINRQPPILMSANDFEKRDKLCNDLIRELTIMRVSSSILNYHNIIQEHLTK